MPRSKKALQGQLNVLGDVLDYKSRYLPHKVVGRTGEAVVVLRLPPEVDTLDRTAAMEAAAKMARGSKTQPNKFFYIKKPRSSPRWEVGQKSTPKE